MGPPPSPGAGAGPKRRDRARPAEKSIAFYVGRDRTEDGSVLTGGFGHEPSSHWLEITPRREFPAGTEVEVGVTGDARLPGERIRIPQVRETARYVTTNYSEFAGFPPPLTNGGLNEHGVAGRDVWSPSRPELVDMTPDPQRGVSYSDLARLCMERATSAAEAVDVVADLVGTHGYATYGGNSHLFADAREGWIVVEFAGGRGLWAAERLGPGDVRVSYPGYVGEIPIDVADDPDYRCSENLVPFAVDQGWFDPDGRETMDVREVYGREFPSAPGTGRESLHRYPPALEEELASMAPVSLRDVLALVRDPRWADDSAGYGQVARLRGDRPAELGTLWATVATPAAAPMVPIPVGAADVPPEYKQHRYLTKGSATSYLHPEHAGIEATRSAARTFKRLFYHVSERPRGFLGPVTAALEAFEAGLLDEGTALEADARAAVEPGDETATRERLTRTLHARLDAALRLGEGLLDAVEAETRSRFGIRTPDRELPEGATWRPESHAMTHPPGPDRRGDRPHCYVEGLERYPRSHGSYRRLIEEDHPLLADVTVDPDSSS